MQILEDSVTFKPVSGAKNARLNHPYGPTITMSQEEDECPVRVTKEYLAKTKDREDHSDKLFVSRKISPVVAVCNGTIASWLKETLTLVISGLPQGQPEKAGATYMASQGASIRTIMESGDWAHISMVYGHYIRYLYKEILVRILEQTSIRVQGVNIARIAKDNPH